MNKKPAISTARKREARRVSVSLDADGVATALRLGNGNMSAGIRQALREDIVFPRLANSATISDREELVQLFKRFGIGFHERPEALEIEANAGAKVSGYSGFVCLFYFDEAGGFIEASVVE